MIQAFRDFENSLLVAAYQIADETGEDYVTLRDIVERYHISFKPGWPMRALRSLIESGYSDDARHLGGDDLGQSIALTPSGFKRGEELSNYVIVEPVDHSATATEEDPSQRYPASEELLQQLIPASDRMVSPAHNAPSYVEAVDQVSEAHRLIASSNQLPEIEKHDTLVHLEAGLSLLRSAGRFAIGSIRYLVLDRLKAAFEGLIEDAFKVVIIGAFMTLAAILIAML